MTDFAQCWGFNKDFFMATFDKDEELLPFLSRMLTFDDKTLPGTSMPTDTEWTIEGPSYSIRFVFGKNKMFMLASPHLHDDLRPFFLS